MVKPENNKHTQSPNINVNQSIKHLYPFLDGKSGFERGRLTFDEPSTKAEEEHTQRRASMGLGRTHKDSIGGCVVTGVALETVAF